MQVNLEMMLLISILVYIVLAIALASLKGHKYLNNAPREEIGKEYHQHNERINLIFAGFSLTALALLLDFQLSSIIQFFSLAFSLLILSFVFLRFRFKNLFVYLSDVLLNAGLLSIGCGFLVFFSNISWFDGSTIIFSVFFVALYIASLVNCYFFIELIENKEGEKK